VCITTLFDHSNDVVTITGGNIHTNLPSGDPVEQVPEVSPSYSDQKFLLLSGSKDRSARVWKQESKAQKKRTHVVKWEGSTLDSTAVISSVLIVCLISFSYSLADKE
jgi:WD40 repeat protein